MAVAPSSRAITVVHNLCTTRCEAGVQTGRASLSFFDGGLLQAEGAQPLHCAATGTARRRGKLRSSTPNESVFNIHPQD
jgi:hypothetical protein